MAQSFKYSHLVLSALFTLALTPVAEADDSDLSEFDEMFEEPSLEHQFDIPVVLTASRLRQSQLDSPASVTVIEADTISALGFKDIQDIFRLVPGMLVGYHSGFGEKLPSVSYHGTQAAEHRRLQVLIDGRSVFKPGLARVEWNDIPLAIEDIARIEVIRGPNSAAYGANSYLGVINILTKHPEEEMGNKFKVTSGNRNVWQNYVSVSNKFKNTDFRFTAGSKLKSGFDTLEENGDDENLDGTEAVYTTLRTFTQLTSAMNFELQGGYKSGVNEEKQNLDTYLNYVTDESIDAKDTYVWTKLNYEFSANQFSHLQIYSQNFDRNHEWTACFSEDPENPGSPVLGLPAFYCGVFSKNLKETKSEIEYQHTSIWNDTIRTVMGIRFRVDELDSRYYNDGYSDNENKSAFINAEYKPNKFVTLNLGGMYEEDVLNDDDFSPRIAVNAHLTDNDSIRFIYSQAIRSPDLYEQEGGSYFYIDNVINNNQALGDLFLFTLGSGTGQLDSEKIYSHEISYFGLYPSLNAQVDIKLFYDELSSLISESLAHDVPLSNDNQLLQKGVEGQFIWQATTANKLMLSFNYTDQKSDFVGNTKDIDKELSLSADRSGSFVWINESFENTQLSTAYYHVENWNIQRKGSTGGFTFSRLDLNVNHHMILDDHYQLTLQAALQYRIDDDPLLYQKNNYDDKAHYYASVQLSF
jgi:iron complex outermembrane receptor protein